jgi:hypothetical protein
MFSMGRGMGCGSFLFMVLLGLFVVELPLNLALGEALHCKMNHFW